MDDHPHKVETVAVIPARGGSKRIPRKNIRPFLGIPLLARTVALLLGSEVFDRIVVSTEDDEIASIGDKAGAEILRRPHELAGDSIGTLPVVQHAVRQLDAKGDSAAFVCCVYPAAVLTQPADIRSAREMLLASGADYVIPVTRFAHPVQRALRLREDSGCEMFWPQNENVRSQDLEAAYHDAGQFYWGRREAWLEARPLFSSKCRLFVLPSWRVRDIDTMEDWEHAEMIFKQLQGHG